MKYRNKIGKIVEIDIHTPMIIATEIKSNYINNSEIDIHTPMIIATEIKSNYINNSEIDTHTIIGVCISISLLLM
jgi:hypothetical protein